MDEHGGGHERLLGDLLDASHTLSMEQLPGTVAGRAARAGLHDTLIYLADVRQEVVRLLTGSGPGAKLRADGEPAELRIDGTLPGRAFQTGQVLSVTGAGGGGRYRWWTPLLDGTERIGVLRADTDTADERTRTLLWRLASLVALLVVSKRPHSDSGARLVRTRPMTVAAEMQWNLMPPQTFSNDEVTISASLEPAYEVSGDAFDYGLTGGVVHLAVFDAMGHDTAAGLTANLAVAACRNHRRQGAGLDTLGERIEQTLLSQFGHDRFVTAVLAELDTRTGVFCWANHGHHLPVLIRGGRWATDLACRPGHPLGSDLGLRTTLCQERLQPGDRVVLYTDGILEARDSLGREFGLERFTDFLIRHHTDDLPVPETLRRLSRRVMAYHHGSLQDDATVLLTQWHGPGQAPSGAASDGLGRTGSWRQLRGRPETAPRPPLRP
ncbi:PP2C family protein-serine/threonine phosphatase [Actinorugispora endophytica]|uniref:Stage II sporulation protein E n=1 Tax=Actinorugispora endophytica TaxID=1605990 RepID=A0A4R6V8J1_9ACTN|nr:stage II sporulation protein E [Actinorugispora endophytica]